MNPLFSNRREAGFLLARKIRSLEPAGNPLVLGLPRGGVPIAFEIALALDAPLDVYTVRKLGVPGNEELAMGAIASGGVRVLNTEVIEALRIPPDVIDAVADREEVELHGREQQYRIACTPPVIAGRVVILADDGIATGSTMVAAVQAVRQAGAAKLIGAAPVASRASVSKLRKTVDQLVILNAPENFDSVCAWYQDFSEVTDDEVQDLLRMARQRELNQVI